VVCGAASTLAVVVGHRRMSWRLAWLAPQRGRPAKVSAPRRDGPVLAIVASAAAGLALTAVVGGPAGAVSGLVAAAASWRWLALVRARPADRLRRAVADDLPYCLDLLVACLAAGTPVQPAVVAVAAAVGEPIGPLLAQVGAGMGVGAEPATAWDRLGRDAGLDAMLEPLARAMRRAAESGAPPAAGLARLAADLRDDRAARAAEAAQAVGVRAAGPLGLCFLPAFVVLGVLPTAWGLVRVSLAGL